MSTPYFTAAQEASNAYDFEGAASVAPRRVYVGYVGPEFSGKTATARRGFFDDSIDDISLKQYASRITLEGKRRKGRILFSSQLSRETGLDKKIARLYALPGMSGERVSQLLENEGINVSATSVRRVAKRVLNNNPENNDTYGRIARQRKVPFVSYEAAA